jgi:hypothetical protein
MAGRGAVRRWRQLTVAAVALYAVVLAVAPFEHHDLICHLKTPQHCTSCAASPLSVDPHTTTSLDGCRLTDAGRAVAGVVISEGTLLPSVSSGRSPPARS